MSSRKNLSQHPKRAAGPLLRISEVARRVGISSSALRAWEHLGLVAPQRTRAGIASTPNGRPSASARIFLRRARGMNPAAIVHILKRQGIVLRRRKTLALPGQRFRRLRTRRGLSSRKSPAPPACPWVFSARSSVARCAPRSPPCGASRVSIARISFVVRSRRRKSAAGAPCAEKNPGDHCRRAHGVARLGQHRHGAAPVSHKPNGGSGESYAHEGEEFLHILRGEFEIWLGGREHYRLKTGDSLYFESSTPHRWRNPGRLRNMALVGQHSPHILTGRRLNTTQRTSGTYHASHHGHRISEPTVPPKRHWVPHPSVFKGADLYSTSSTDMPRHDVRSSTGKIIRGRYMPSIVHAKVFAGAASIPRRATAALFLYCFAMAPQNSQ